MQKLKNIIITGCNQGIGYGIVENLMQKSGWNIIMACRNVQLAKQSKQELLKKFNTPNLHVEQLDITDKNSIENFTKTIAQKYKTIDVLINNAGVARKGDAFDQQVAEWTFATNFYGTINFTDSILHHLSDSAKIIFIGSSVGKLTRLSQPLKHRFLNPNLTRNQLYTLMKQFIDSVKQNTYKQKGWPKTCYGVSKIGINIFARVLSQQPQIINKKLQIYSLCPGYVNTNMTSHKGVLTIQQGALTPVFLVQLPFQINQKYQGQFFEKCALSSLQ